MSMSECVVFPASSCALLYSWSHTGFWRRYYTSESVLLGISRSYCCSRTDHEGCELPEYHREQLASLDSNCLLDSSRNSMLHVTGFELCWNGSRNIILNLAKVLPPNEIGLNPVEHIWSVMERQVRAEKQRCRNILEFYARCVNN